MGLSPALGQVFVWVYTLGFVSGVSIFLPYLLFPQLTTDFLMTGRVSLVQKSNDNQVNSGAEHHPKLAVIRRLQSSCVKDVLVLVLL